MKTLLWVRHSADIHSAFVIDFDAHTGDGTIDVLSQWPETFVFNPYVDIVAVSAGFDSGVNVGIPSGHTEIRGLCRN